MEPNWIELDGAVNARDLGGLPLSDGGTVAARRLIRSDNLQSLTLSDVRVLVGECGVSAIADLRTGVEVDAEGPGPMTREPAVTVRHLSLFPEAGHNTDVAALDDDTAVDDAAPGGLPTEQAPVTLPWQNRTGDGRGAAGVYLRYLDDRADSVLEALRLIAYSDGATLVHCAAGKDRTGVVVALALAEVGVTREAIVADYAASADRIELVMARLKASPTYSGDVGTTGVDKHRPRAVTMERFLDAMDADFGGAAAWLRAHGWAETDADALRAKLTK